MIADKPCFTRDPGSGRQPAPNSSSHLDHHLPNLNTEGICGVGSIAATSNISTRLSLFGISSPSSSHPALRNPSMYHHNIPPSVMSTYPLDSLPYDILSPSCSPFDLLPAGEGGDETLLIEVTRVERRSWALCSILILVSNVQFDGGVIVTSSQHSTRRQPKTRTL